MKKKLIFFPLLLVVALCCFSLYFFRYTVSYSLWKSYYVFSVNLSSNVDAMINAFNQKGLTGVLINSNSKKMNEFSTFRGFLDSPANTLNNIYFFDKDKSVQLLYIPKKNNSIHTLLKDYSFLSSVNSSPSFFLPPLLFFIVLVFFTFFVKNKLFYIAVQFPFLLLSFAFPLYHIVALLCLQAYAFIFIQNYWQRSYYFSCFFKSKFFLSVIFLLVLALFFLGIKSLISFLAILICIAVFMYICYTIMQVNRNKRFFNTIPILPASMVNGIIQKMQLLRFVCFGAVVILNVLYFAVFFTASGLIIPAPIENTQQHNFSMEAYQRTKKINNSVYLPDFTDYILGAWEKTVAPYQRLNEKKQGEPLANEKVFFPAYSFDSDEKTTLHKTERVVATFNDDFLKHVVDTVQKRSDLGAEQLLLSEGGFVKTEYQSSSFSRKNRESKIGLLFAVATFFLCIGLIFINRKRKA